MTDIATIHSIIEKEETKLKRWPQLSHICMLASDSGLLQNAIQQSGLQTCSASQMISDRAFHEVTGRALEVQLIQLYSFPSIKANNLTGLEDFFQHHTEHPFVHFPFAGRDMHMEGCFCICVLPARLCWVTLV